MLDLRPAAERAPPSNIEAEQALIGILLYESDNFDNVADALQPEHFYEPFHGRIFKKIGQLRQDGSIADPMILDQLLRSDPAYKDLGGIRYLADMIDRAPPAANGPDYAQAIVELYNRRRLLELAAKLTGMALQGAEDESGKWLSSSDLIDLAESELLSIERADSKLALTNIADAADEVMAYVDDRTEVLGVHCGLTAIHEQLGPLLPGELYLIPGRPSMGKSAVASNIALRVAAPEWWAEAEMDDDLIVSGYEEAARLYGLRAPERAGVLELNGEMTRGQMMRRHFSDVGYAIFGPRFPTYKAIRDKHVSVDQRQMMEHVRGVVGQWPLEMLKRSGLKVSQLRSIARRQIAVWKRQGIRPGLMIIDHVGLLRPEGRTGSRYEAQTEIAIDLHQLAEDIEMPVLALVQLSRATENREDKRPQLSDLRDSGGWEENADAIIFPFRDSYYATKETEPPEGTFGSAENAAWAEWDARCRSKAIEYIPGKVREGSTSKTTTGWADLPWNAIRNREPKRMGAML